MALSKILFTVIFISIVGITLSDTHPMVAENHRRSAFVFQQDFCRKTAIHKIIVPSKDIAVGQFFDYIDSLVQKYDTLLPYNLSEHLLVRANPWIIDTLAGTDYYKMIERDSFVYDQRKLHALRAGDTLILPDPSLAAALIQKMKKTILDINIPEFKLRIFEDDSLLYTFPIRVGQNRSRYLEMCKRVTDLRTKIGKGKIFRHVRDPDFYDPVSCKQFYQTKRDDERTTLMPQIPWIETEINGIRNGQMIHPTTNPKTLGKPYSNGCIGTAEADAWIIYYHAPIGTALQIRYDLETRDEFNQPRPLEDIYNYNKQ